MTGLLEAVKVDTPYPGWVASIDLVEVRGILSGTCPPRAIGPHHLPDRGYRGVLVPETGEV